MDVQTDAAELCGRGISGQRATFGSRPVVAIVDMCNAYFKEGSPLDLNQPAVITAVEQLVGCAHDADVPVIWTRVQYEPVADNGQWYATLSVLRAIGRGNPCGHSGRQYQPLHRTQVRRRTRPP